MKSEASLPLQILEIGDQHHFKAVYPDRTTLLWTGRRRSIQLQPDAYLEATPRHFMNAIRNVQQGKFDLVVAYPPQQSPFHPRNWLRSLLHSPRQPVAAVTRVFGVTALRFMRFDTPLVVLDMHDQFTIHRSNFFLFDRAKLYFKRELPIDRWNVLYGSGHPLLPTSRIRRNGRWIERLSKLRPISIHCGTVKVAPDDEIFAAKTSDVFFAGAIEQNSTIRQTGLAQMKRLAERGFRIDIPEERLPSHLFYERMSRSWLAWSPSGMGWDCYRHYEAPQCLAVPVINYPTIERYAPLQDKVHAFYYPPEGDGLVQVVEAALADKARLKEMAIAARDHVQAHHAGEALCDHVLREALGAR